MLERQWYHLPRQLSPLENRNRYQSCRRFHCLLPNNRACKKGMEQLQWDKIEIIQENSEIPICVCIKWLSLAALNSKWWASVNGLKIIPQNISLSLPPPPSPPHTHTVNFKEKYRKPQKVTVFTLPSKLVSDYSLLVSLEFHALLCGRHVASRKTTNECILMHSKLHLKKVFAQIAAFCVL